MKVLGNLPRMKIAEMVKLWHNAVRISADPKKRKMHADARKVIDGVNAEWARRLKKPFDPDEFFHWPSTAAERGRGNLDTSEWLPEGALTCLGYHVGSTSSLTQRTRERLLSEIFSGVIPPAFPADYVNGWGHPDSATRLQKMAETIAALARNAKRRRDARMTKAVDHWEQDLQFLYYEYYVDKFRFGWPTTGII